MQSFVLRTSLAGVMLSLSLSCAKQKDKDYSIPPSRYNHVVGVDGSGVGGSTEAKAQKIKALYSELGGALRNSSNADARSLGGLADAIGKAPTSDVSDYAKSGLGQDAEQGLQLCGARNASCSSQNQAALLNDNRTRLAAVGLLSLGALSGYGVYRAMGSSDLRGVPAAAICITSVVIGAQLLADPNNSAAKKHAQLLTLSAGVLSLMVGVGYSMLSHYMESSRGDSYVYKAVKVEGLNKAMELNKDKFVFDVYIRSLAEKDFRDLLSRLDKLALQAKSSGLGSAVSDKISLISMQAKKVILSDEEPSKWGWVTAEKKSAVTPGRSSLQREAALFEEYGMRRNDDRSATSEDETSSADSRSPGQEQQVAGEEEVTTEEKPALSAEEQKDKLLKEVEKGIKTHKESLGDGFKGNLAIALGGAGLIAASQLGFNLSQGKTRSPYEILMEINQALANY